ncbi:MAG: CDP-glucose 4,6-dehydratase [Acidimicrobiia bacterium]
MAPFGDFYDGRRVFVTGDTGFKGSWLSLWLTKLGASVTGYSDGPITTPNNFTASDVASRIRHVDGLVEDSAAVAAAIDEAQPEVILHLAGQALVGKSFDDPRGTIATNALGTANVLDAALAIDSVQSVVIVTSDKCYAPRETDVPYLESDRLGGDDPYSLSKACAELVFEAFQVTIEHRAPSGTRAPAIGSARAGNVFGGGDWSEKRLIPDMVRAIGEHEPLVLRVPHARRPWQHVLEPISGYLWLGRMLASGDLPNASWNFGPPPQGAHTVEEMVRFFVAEWGIDLPIEITPQQQFVETLLLRLDPTAAAHDLGWHTVLEPREALALTARWYRDYSEGTASMADVSSSQIDEYVERARTNGLTWAK